MKIILILLSLLVFLTESITAQRDRGTLYAGAAYSHFNKRADNLVMVYAAFTKTFSGPILIELNGTYGFTEISSPVGDAIKLKTFSTGLEGFYKVWNNDYQQILIGLGVSGRYFNAEWQLDESLFTPTSSFRPGLNILLRYDVTFDDNWLIGLRGWLERYGQTISNYAAGLHVGYKF